MKYIINIEKSINQEFEIEAENVTRAFELAVEKYSKEGMDAKNTYISAKQIAIVGPDDEASEWVEF